MPDAKLTFEAIGTRWNIQMLGTISPELAERIQKRIREFDKAYSRFRPDSLVTRMAQTPGAYELPEDGFVMLRFYEQLYRATNGLVTPLIGQALSNAGYDAGYSFRQRPMEKPPAWDDVISYDRHYVTVAQPALLDFGAAGKGYLVDIVGALLRRAGLDSFIINASGDMLHRSENRRPIEVGLENPVDDTEVIGVARLGNQSLCASSGSKRQWGNFHHIVNPATLQPAADILATWVIADDTMTADGLATALFFTAPQKLLSEFTFAYAILDKSMGLSYSKNFPVRTFEAEP